LERLSAIIKKGKFMISENELMPLFLKAKQAAENSYSPYSQFQVGCAILTHSGRIFTGSNVENSSFSNTVCAERNVLSNMIGKGIRDIKAVAVWGKIDSLAPCGACRQFIYEFGKDIVIIFMHEGNLIQKTISELLPFGFTL
jgi:cytidine deaminase